MSSTPIVTILLDPVRLMIAGSLAGVVRTPAQVADHTGVEQPDVIEAIDALHQIGLVEQTGPGYTLPTAALQRLVSELADT